MEERRKHTRYDVAYPVEAEYVQKLGLIDLSSGGAAFISEKELKVSERINLRIFLKNRMFDLECEVVHSTSKGEYDYSIGVRFLDTSRDFNDIFTKEVEQITQLHRENNLYQRKGISFREASLDFLEDVFAL